MRFTQLSDWLAWQETLHPDPIDLGLERVRRVARRLGLVRPAPRVILVGGTNGKGSCAALIEGVLRAAGYRVGLYTSPHLLRYTERIRIDGREITEARLCELFERIDQAREETSLTYFEFGTLAALAAFAEAQAEVAVLEVGMGGRLDAVNIVDPDVSVITSIGLDHQAWLGNTREAIAREKAGILRPGRVGVCADPDPPHTLVGAARRLGAALQRIGYEVGIEHHGHSWNWRWGEHVLAGLPQPALPGGHQRRNAAAALTALYALPRIHIERHAIEQALRDLAVPGRFQVMPGPVETVLDVAHNPQSAEALARVLRARPAGGRTLAVFAALADKDIEGIVDPLVGLISGWALSAPRAERALSAADLAARVTPRLGGGAPGVHAGVRDAYAAARAEARPGDRVLVFGSFYTVAEVLTEFV